MRSTTIIALALLSSVAVAATAITQWDDKNSVLAAVRQFGHSLRYASEKLRGNDDIVLAAVEEFGRSLQHASTEFRHDIDGDKLREDPEFVLAAQDRDPLRYASTELRDDPEVVLPAVRQFGYSLQFASEWLRCDPEVVLAAVRQNGNSLQFASEWLRGDPKVVLAAVRPRGRTQLQLHSVTPLRDSNLFYSPYWLRNKTRNTPPFSLV